MASTTRNSVSRHVPKQFGDVKDQTLVPKKNNHVNVVNNNISVKQLFSVAKTANTTYMLDGVTFLTVQLNDPSLNKNGVFKFVNNSGHAHEITGAMPNIITEQGKKYSKVEFDTQKGSYITLMSDGTTYNVLDVSGTINYE